MNTLTTLMERSGPHHAVAVGQPLTPAQTLDVTQHADVVEFRADLFPQHDTPYLRQEIDNYSDLPLLLTVRSEDEGGTPVVDRLSIYRALMHDVDGVDVELASELAPAVIKLAKDLGKLVIISNHDFASTPERHVLDSRYSAAMILGADYFKIAALASTPADYQTLVNFTIDHADTRDVIALAMGNRYGPLSRITLPFLGSRLTYSYPEDLSAVAPGQVGHRTLASLLNQVADLSSDSH